MPPNKLLVRCLWCLSNPALQSDKNADRRRRDRFRGLVKLFAIGLTLCSFRDALHCMRGLDDGGGPSCETPRPAVPVV
jgi:hypothetical protein